MPMTKGEMTVRTICPARASDDECVFIKYHSVPQRVYGAGKPAPQEVGSTALDFLDVVRPVYLALTRATCGSPAARSQIPQIQVGISTSISLTIEDGDRSAFEVCQ